MSGFRNLTRSGKHPKQPNEKMKNISLAARVKTREALKHYWRRWVAGAITLEKTPFSPCV